MKRNSLVLSIICLFATFFAEGQIVTIPDPIFKNYLVNNAAINLNSDSEIQVSEANAFTGSINCNFIGITNLTGIEAFINLTGLSCSNNPITTINLTNNVQLTSLSCDNCNLTTLNLNANSNLQSLFCSNNQISILDVSNHTALQFLTCHGNSMTSLQLAGCSGITVLECFNNQLTTLDVSDCVLLEQLLCYNNDITTLDFTANPALIVMVAAGNELTFINMANGTNTNMSWFKADNNPNLTCIQVDDAAWSTTNWTQIDPTTSFSECCFGNPTSATDSHAICGTSFTWIDGITYTSANNTATWTLTNVSGCDSVITLNLSFLSPSSGTDVITSCQPINWIDGNTYTASNNTATWTLTAANGCDSVVTLDFTFSPYSFATNEVITACDSYSWIDGNTYTTSNNTATHLLTSVNGCDSLIQLNLTIKHSTSSVQNVSTCGAYTWINCVTYTSSTTATHTLTNAVGCDSVITLNLTILPDSYSTDVVSTCAPFIWLDGNTYTSSNNSATHILTNAAGCDSVISLDLTILPTSTVHQIVQTCGPYTWIDGNTYTSSINSVTHTLTNAAGCDSTLMLQLTIVDIDTSVTVNSGTLTANQNGATYQWIDCSNSGSILPGETGQSFTPQVDGNYAVRISSGNCTELSRCIAVNTQQLNEQGIPPIQVFPNPVFDLLTISSEAEIQSVQIYNASGQLVQTSVSTSISTGNLAPGVYHLRILTEQGTVVKQFIKE